VCYIVTERKLIYYFPEGVFFLVTRFWSIFFCDLKKSLRLFDLPPFSLFFRKRLSQITKHKRGKKKKRSLLALLKKKKEISQKTRTQVIMDIMGNPGEGGGRGGMGDDQDAFAQQFKQFCMQPENKEKVQEHQRKEIRRAERVGHRIEACGFRDKVLESDYEAQQNIAPFMEHKFLRRIIQTFCNDEQGDFGKWAKNPRVIEMLQHAKDLVDNGYVQEEELEHRMVEYLKNPNAEGHEQFDKRVNRKINVESKDLVSALNEQCTLRHEGNLLYVKKNFEEAKEKYEQALSIMNLIKATDRQMGQFEIEQNKSFCLMNIASVCIGMKDYGEAIEHLNKAEEVWPEPTGNFKLYTRRARAHIYRANFAEAKKDLQTAKSIDPKHEEIEEVEWMIDAFKSKYATEEKERARTMFKFPKVLMSDQKRKKRSSNRWPHSYGW